ncbi:hypothetical protein BVtw_03530 [Bartonella vinsonii subsp. berkhoffii str. Tweed]|uniref:Phage protein n=1 Tax=Bartonella vinsonii subsp. berkhoffii str. Tweed TaxID=1094502 RepID=N6VN83_BARVB|nr:hypothetical protein [Bartonella vinsonii]ENN95345.1 hypothetical protein BVtw_03530 [Bartonella vinsonii subsp. berkhoffii str. Tweed]
MHPRETIRGSFVTLIKAAKTATGDNVFNMRDFNFSIEKMSAINISTQSETIEDGYNYGVRRRVLTVDVECYATCEDGARFVDQLAWEVEKNFYANPNLNNTVETCHLQNIAFAFGDNGALALHGAILTFEVIYVTNIPSPDTEEGSVTAGFVEPFLRVEPETGVRNKDKYHKIEGAHVRAAR